MSRRITTRLAEPVMRLVLEKAAKEEKSISQTIEELVSNAMLCSTKDEINSLVGSLKELSSLLSCLQKDFQVHKDKSEREFAMILNLLVVVSEIGKKILTEDENEKAWLKYQQKYNEYLTTGRIRI